MTYIIENVSGKILNEFCLIKSHQFDCYFILNERSHEYFIFKDKILSIKNYNIKGNNIYRTEDIDNYYAVEINPSFNGKIEFIDEETALYFKLKYC